MQYVNPGGQRKNDFKIQKKNARFFSDLKKWADMSDQIAGEAMVGMMCALVCDVNDCLPKNATRRRHCWRWLQKSVLDLYTLFDAEAKNQEGLFYGGKMADKVAKMLQQ